MADMLLKDMLAIMAGDEEASLKHYGIKGMKWGVRRTDAQLDAAGGGGAVRPSKPKPEKSADFEKYQAVRTQGKKSGTETLSNKEMQALVTRMQLEQQYAKLIENNPTPSERVMKFVSDKGRELLMDEAMSRMKGETGPLTGAYNALKGAINLAKAMR